MKLDKSTILKKMLEAELLDQNQISEAITICKKRNEDLYEYIKLKFEDSTDQIHSFFSDKFDFVPIILSDIVLNENIINRVPVDLIVNHLIIPAFQIRQTVYLAVADPMDIDGLNEVIKITGEESRVLLSKKEHVIKALAKYIFRPRIASILK